MIMKMYADSKHAPLWLEIKQPQGCGTSTYAFFALILLFHVLLGTSKTMKKDMQNLVVISNEVKLETNEKI